MVVMIVMMTTRFAMTAILKVMGDYDKDVDAENDGEREDDEDWQPMALLCLMSAGVTFASRREARMHSCPEQQ